MGWLFSALLIYGHHLKIQQHRIIIYYFWQFLVFIGQLCWSHLAHSWGCSQVRCRMTGISSPKVWQHITLYNFKTIIKVAKNQPIFDYHHVPVSLNSVNYYSSLEKKNWRNLSWSFQAALTNCHKLGNLQTVEIHFLQFWGLEVWRTLASSDSDGDPLPSF